MAFILQYGFYKEFGNSSSSNLVQVHNYAGGKLGTWYSAFLQNLIRSILFINLLVCRKNRKGQNLTVAFAKWIVTLAPTILFGIILESNLVLIAGIFCSVSDVVYIYLLMNKRFLKVQ